MTIDPNRRLEADGLVLEPLTVAHAEEMFALLADPALYRHLDEAPPASLGALQQTYTRRERRASPDGRESWLNWVVRAPGGRAVGYVQATVKEGGDTAIGYVFGVSGQGRGFATQATRAMVEHLFRTTSTRRLTASVDPANLRSIGLLGRLGFCEATPAERGAYDGPPTDRLFLMTPVRPR